MNYQFETSVQFLKGVGPQLRAGLEAGNLRTLGDLVGFLPRTYQYWRKVQSLDQSPGGEFLILPAKLLRVSSYKGGTQRIFNLQFEDVNKQKFTGLFFRQPYRGYFERFRCPQNVWILGEPQRGAKGIEFHHPEIRDFSETVSTEDHLLPIYSEIGGLSSARILKLIQQCFELLKDPDLWKSFESLPDGLINKHQLLSKKECLYQLHFPNLSTKDQVLNKNTLGYRRLIFEEFFFLELAVGFRKMGHLKERSKPLIGTSDFQEYLRTKLPFKLTVAQNRCIEEISENLKQTTPMNRLLQGDVGSGKTLTFFFGILQAIESGEQVALMVPSEILALQHFNTLQNLVANTPLKLALLTSKIKGSERTQLLSELAQGKIQLIIGTHALIEDSVNFRNLSYVIIDEQHRFGVSQRRRLQQKGISPHLLLVTATPIPRTLAMTVYGDMDVSLLNEKPPGRTEIINRVIQPSQKPLLLDFVAKQIKKGHQAYFVFPLIEESEKTDLKGAQSAFEELKTHYPQMVFGLLHSKLKENEKDKIMKSFREGSIQVLVSTTVIEVGVDVPNAVIMVVENAERFGLSQLHQLRGRVGRGSLKSYCIFVKGEGASPEAENRLKLMAETEDGFRISEADLEWRGPGDLLGSEQAGLLGFQWADFKKHNEIWQEAQVAAKELFEKDPTLSKIENQNIKKELEKKLKGEVCDHMS